MLLFLAISCERNCKLQISLNSANIVEILTLSLRRRYLEANGAVASGSPNFGGLQMRDFGSLSKFDALFLVIKCENVGERAQMTDFSPRNLKTALLC